MKNIPHTAWQVSSAADHHSTALRLLVVSFRQQSTAPAVLQHSRMCCVEISSSELQSKRLQTRFITFKINEFTKLWKETQYNTLP